MASEDLQQYRDEDVDVDNEIVDGTDTNIEDVPASPPVNTDPKKAKAEQKRLEKEEKEREKKRKQEEKRQLKENARKEKSNAPTRKQQRDEKKQKSGIANFMSPARQTVRPKNTVRGRVLLLDGSEIEVEIEREAKGKLLVDRVCEYVNVMERDYFSCTYSTAEGKFWLRHEKKISRQIGNGKWAFEFSVKFYPPEPAILQEELTRYQLVLQIRDDILSGRVPCSQVASALLGSCTVQSELGDYDVAEHGSSIDYIRDIQFAPNQTDELLMKIAEMHQTQLQGRTPAEAELMYLENAKKLEMYGIHLQQAKDAELVDIHVGVCADGLHVYHNTLHVNRFPWPKITKMSYKNNVFYVKIRPGAFERFQNIVGFKMPSKALAKRFWLLSLEHHTFFRFKEPVVFDQSFISRFGSTRSQFAGRTLYQSRIWSSTHERAAPAFERTLSTRSLTSRSLNSSSFLDRDDKKRSVSMDVKAGRRGDAEDYIEDFSDDRQVAVVAGTAADADRVAYVKTVRPSSVDADERPMSEAQPAGQPRYTNETFQPGADNTPPVNRSSSAADEAPKRKKKKKKSPSTGSQRTSANEDAKEYKSAKNGTVESRVEKRPVIHHESVDHDLELTKAITKVTDMDEDMSVEKIEIDPSNVAKSMTGGRTEAETIEIAPNKTKKKKKKSQREQVPEMA